MTQRAISCKVGQYCQPTAYGRPEQLQNPGEVMTNTLGISGSRRLDRHQLLPRGFEIDNYMVDRYSNVF